MKAMISHFAQCKPGERSSMRHIVNFTDERYRVLENAKICIIEFKQIEVIEERKVSWSSYEIDTTYRVEGEGYIYESFSTQQADKTFAFSGEIKPEKEGSKWYKGLVDYEIKK